MKIKIAIYGGTNLASTNIAFVRSLTKQLIKYPEIIIVSGGFDHDKRYPQRKSVDRIVLDTAEKYIAAPDFINRFETWISRDNPRRQVIRFKKGKVTEITGSAQARRFNMIQNVDALITIEGQGNTRSVIELALAINKPVLPISFTGGDSKKMWSLYKDDIIELLKINKALYMRLQNKANNIQSAGATGKKVADFMKQVARKTCLVLMPFEKSSNHFYDNYLKKAIANSNYVDHRIDRNDPAGNIPELFESGLNMSKAIVVDITGYNPNVLYELGHVHSRNIIPLIILRTRSGRKKGINDLPFYMRQEMIVTEKDNKEGHKKIQSAVESFLQNHP